MVAYEPSPLHNMPFKVTGDMLFNAFMYKLFYRPSNLPTSVDKDALVSTSKT
jgi:hypothetical protein